MHIPLLYALIPPDVRKSLVRLAWVASILLLKRTDRRSISLVKKAHGRDAGALSHIMDFTYSIKS